MNAHLTTIVGPLLLFTVAGCSSKSQLGASSTSSWPLPNGSTEPANVRIESATTFYCNDVRCQLLGVTESTDPDVREQALDFSRRWFDRIGNYVGIYNSSNPLRNEDGTCVVWIRGYDMYRSRLNAELVRAGLVNVDYSSSSTYNFMVRGKAGEYQETWREQLDQASADYTNGVKPKVLFAWPPNKDERMEPDEAP